MRRHRPDDRARSPLRGRTALVGATVFATLLAACDTGDGKRLAPPTGSTTTAPVATLLSVPLDTADPVIVPTDDPDPPGEPGDFQVFAPWVDGGPIDARYTCDSEDISPALSWAGAPSGAVELAVALVDESAFVDDRPFVHWAVSAIDPGDISVFEGEVPLGAVEALNTFGTLGYQGPCPPVGDGDHRYRLTLYALNQQTELADGGTATDLLDFIEAVSIGETSLTGTYRR